MKPPTLGMVAVMLMTVTWTGCSTTPEPAPPVPDHKPLVVFLVRHAEKVDSSDDPELSPTGHERAGILAGLLCSAEIEYVHTSDYIRTRETAAPTAAQHGLEPALYDPRDLPVLVGKLRETGGRHLVVGHNTTTPALVELLGGGIESEIDEEGEYNRLYIVTIGRDGSASVAMLRYGEPYDPGR